MLYVVVVHVHVHVHVHVACCACGVSSRSGRPPATRDRQGPGCLQQMCIPPGASFLKEVFMFMLQVLIMASGRTVEPLDNR